MVKSVQMLKNVLVATGKAALIGVVYMEGHSNLTVTKPTKLSNWYQINSPNGCGYGYDCTRTKLMDFSGVLIPGYVEARPAMLDEKKILQLSKVQEFLSRPESKRFGEKLALADQQALGYKSGLLKYA